MAKVLIVDDEPDIELLAKQKFRNQIKDGSFNLLFAQNGQEALDLIRLERDIAVVVSDVNMPGMDGLTLLDRLKEISPSTKTIVVSAYGDSKTLRAAMNKGAYDFVTKPVDFNDLCESITRAMSHYKTLSSPLYTYQLLLAAGFPPFVDLNYPHAEKNVLWDAFSTNRQEMYIIGVSCQPSPIPLEISISTTHALLKSNPNLSLEKFEDELSEINATIKSRVMIGHYHLINNVFSFITNGQFKVQHLKLQDKTALMPSQTTFLELGEVISLEYQGSSSLLSLSRIEED